MSATIQKSLPEIKILINAADLIEPEVKKERDELHFISTAILSVATKDKNEYTGKYVVAMRKHVKETTAARLLITRRFDDAKKIVMDFFEEHNSPLESEINRLQNMGTVFIENENRRVEAEEKKRREEFEAAQRAQFALDDAARKAAETGSIAGQMVANRKLEAAKANVQAIIATPEPEANRAKGQTLKKKLCFEVTDILALVKARPDLCDIQPKKSAINAVCGVNLPPIPGLRLWEESVSTYTTR